MKTECSAEKLANKFGSITIRRVATGQVLGQKVLELPDMKIKDVKAVG